MSGFMSSKDIGTKLIQESGWQRSPSNLPPTFCVMVDETPHPITFMAVNCGIYIYLCESPRTVKQTRRQIMDKVNKDFWFKSRMILVFRDGVDFIWRYCGKERLGLGFTDLRIENPTSVAVVEQRIKQLFGLTSKG